MVDLNYVNISSHDLSVGVTANGQWWNFATSQWEAPFVAANHLKACERFADFTSIQKTTVPSAALIPGCFVIDFIVGTSDPMPNSVLAYGEDWQGPFARQGMVFSRF